MFPQPLLTSPRLSLRPFTPADAAQVQRLAGERQVADTTLAIPHPYADGMAEAWIATHADLAAQGRELVYALCADGGCRLIGAMGLVLTRSCDRAELGYWVGRPWWNQGYATEAARVLVRWAFTDLGLNRIEATHMSRNPASGRVLRKIGMRHEGCSAQAVTKWDRYEDIERYGLLRSDILRPGGDPLGR